MLHTVVSTHRDNPGEGAAVRGALRAVATCLTALLLELILRGQVGKHGAA